jgi:hypothetical protein
VGYGPADSAAPNEPSLNLVQDHYRYEDQIVINLQPEQSSIPLPNFYVFLSTLNTLHDQLVLIEVLCMDKNCLNQILLIDFLLFERELLVHQHVARHFILVTLDRKDAFSC